MVCESVSRAESVRESDRRRKREEESCVCVCLVQVLGPVCVPGQGMQGSLDSPLLPANETHTQHAFTLPHTRTRCIDQGEDEGRSAPR